MRSAFVKTHFDQVAAPLRYKYERGNALKGKSLNPMGESVTCNVLPVTRYR